MQKEIIAITLDKKTKATLDKYANEHALSRSALIRLIVNDFFLQRRSIR